MMGLSRRNGYMSWALVLIGYTITYTATTPQVSDLRAEQVLAIGRAVKDALELSGRQETSKGLQQRKKNGGAKFMSSALENTYASG